MPPSACNGRPIADEKKCSGGYETEARQDTNREKHFSIVGYCIQPRIWKRDGVLETALTLATSLFHVQVIVRATSVP